MLTSKVGDAVCGQSAAPHLYDGHYRAVHFVLAASGIPLTTFRSLTGRHWFTKEHIIQERTENTSVQTISHISLANHRYIKVVFQRCHSSKLF